MRYEIVLAPGAVESLADLAAYRRTEVRDAVERHLRHEPTRTRKSRIKRLRGMKQPQYRLRVAEIRVFYDVTTKNVEILAIVSKAEADRWLGQHDTPTGDAPGASGGAG
jgi:mRNA interferase RelE/StbE